MVTTRPALILFLLIIIAGTGPSELSGQVRYVAEQAAAGEAIYEQSCAVCHLPNLQGSFEAPQLAGPNFRLNWGGSPLNTLRDVLTTMPPQAVNSLSEDEYSSVAAYLLSENGLDPGASPHELTSSHL